MGIFECKAIPNLQNITVKIKLDPDFKEFV